MSTITSSISHGFKTSEVVPSLQRGIENESLLRNGEDPYPDMPRSKKATRINRPVIIDLEQVSPAEKALIDKAFELISNASDFNLYPAERSNCFDDWKDLLTVISRRVESFTNNHRKVLGSLIPSTMDKDIACFPTANSLRVLQEATNVLRRPRITKVECNRVISELMKLKVDTMMNLSVDEDTEKERELDNLLEVLLEKSRY